MDPHPSVRQVRGHGMISNGGQPTTVSTRMARVQALAVWPWSCQRGQPTTVSAMARMQALGGLPLVASIAGSPPR